MADPIVLTDCFIEINTQVFSGQATNAAISYSAEGLDISAMGTGTKRNIGGAKDWGMSFEFNADEATTGEFFDMVGTVVPVAVRPSGGAISVSNPSYQGEGLITEYSPLDGAFGDAHKVTLSVVSASDLARVTIPPL